MKKTVSIVLITLFPMVLFAQGLLDKMKKFAGEEDQLGVIQGSLYVISGNGSITLEDGTTQEGTIVFKMADDNDTMKYFYFTPAAEMKPKKLRSGDVAYFTVKDKSFYPIKMKEDDLSVGNSRIFMEMVNSSPSDKFKMYRLRKMEQNKDAAGTKPYYLHRGYYVMLPEFKKAHEIIDITFTPFAKKMSDYLKDCPELSKKIADKEKGYKVNMFNGAANDEIFLRVMNEYNSCAK